MARSESQYEYYEQLLRVNESMICAHLRPSSILHDISVLDRSELTAIRRTEKKDSPQAAARELLEKLVASEQKGWFQNFIDALNNNEYGNLAGFLNGTREVKNREAFHQLIGAFNKPLLEILDPGDILPTLREEHGILSKKDVEDINTETRNHGRQDGMVRLLERLPLRHNHWFPQFIRALKHKDMPQSYHNLADEIEPNIAKAVPHNAERDEAEKVILMNQHPTPQNLNQQPFLPDLVNDTKKMEVSPSDCGGPCSDKDAIRQEEAMFHDEGPSTSKRLDAPNLQLTEVAEPLQVNVTRTSQSIGQQYPVVDVMNQLDPPIDGLNHQNNGPVHIPDPPQNQTQPKFPMDQATIDPSFIDNLQTSVKRPKLAAEEKILNISPTPPNFDEQSVIDNTMVEDDPSLDSIDEGRAIEGDGPADAVTPEELVLRNYQLELAKSSVEGQNTIIEAPTGSGKTHVALWITKKHLENESDEEGEVGGKVVFLVPTVELVSQQANMYRTYLNHYRTFRISGDTGESGRVALTSLIEINDILVMTPQVLLNAVSSGELTSLSVFTLMIFDECHHATKDHPYNRIMASYIDDKLAQRSILPQVVGLTASPGVGRARDHEGAKRHLLSLCANLDAIDIASVRENKAELDLYVNKPNERKVEVAGRSKDPFKVIVNDIMGRIEQKRKKYRLQNRALYSDENNEWSRLLESPTMRGSDPYTQWISRLVTPVAKISREHLRRPLVACKAHLKEYNSALMINEDCRTKDAVKFLKNKFQDITLNHKDETDQWLETNFKGRLEALEIAAAQSTNPKLKRLGEVILEKYRSVSDMRAIVFCKTLDMTLALQDWMKETVGLKDLHPDRVTGARAHTEKGGTTQRKRENVLKLFKDGDHKVIIATSVAEEGLDISKCNLVIRYEHVTNEIAMVQSRGRARAENSCYILVGDYTRGSAQKEQLNKIRENMMKHAIDMLRLMPQADREAEIRGLQKEAQDERRMAETGRNHSREQRSQGLTDDWEMRCLKCDNFACTTNELRIVNTSHHFVLDVTLYERCILEDHPRPIQYDEMKKVKKVYCGKCHYDWGICVIYKGQQFCVLKIVSFVIINLRSNKRDTCAKWKNAPFCIDVLQPEELEKYATDVASRSS